MSKRLIGRIKVAEILDVDPATVGRWVNAGRLRVALVRPSGQLRFDPAEVEALRARMEADAATAVAR